MEGAYTGGTIKQRKRKAGRGLTLGKLEKQEKEKPEGAYTGGTYKNKKKKSWKGTHTGGPIKATKIKAGGGLH